MKSKRAVILVLAVAAVVTVVVLRLLRPGEAVGTARALPSPDVLARHCRERVGPPRVLRIADRVYVAIGFDLASTILVRTDAGNVVIDVGMSPERASEARAALEREVPGEVAAIVYTHSHIDHVGGASAWVDDGTPIWATEAFHDHFFKQYGVFREAESRRGEAQFGRHLGTGEVPCSALGRSPDFDAAARSGVRLPTRTFSGEARFEIGGIAFELHEAHGETHDELFVWIPDLRVLLPGDNYYTAFPNLYTIRGTSPRPIDAWIDSLDWMRRLQPEHLVPSHTTPLEGREAIGRALRDYRDGIQWVRDHVVRSANRGASIDEIVETIGLPRHLADASALAELYGQLDWSARAIYTSELGWFDERVETLYPLPRRERATRLVEGLGGAAKVLADAERAAANDPRWCLELVRLLRDAAGTDEPVERVARTEATALRALARDIANTNGRAYLLETARRVEGTTDPSPPPAPDDELVDAIPIGLLFDMMAARLIPERAMDVEESVRFEIGPDAAPETFVVTVRRGVAEIVRGTALPGTPDPIAIVRADATTWRRLSVERVSPVEALASGSLRIEGNPLSFYGFVDRFRRGM